MTSIWHEPTNRFDALMCVRSLGLHDGSYTEVSSHRFSSLLTIHGEHLVRKWSEPEVVVCSGSTCEMSRKVKETGGTCAILRPGPSKVKYER